MGARRNRRSPTLKDVARAAGVSQATVSRVLNHHPHISAEVQKAVLKASKDLRYRPNQVAQSLARGATRILGLLVADITNPFYAETARVITETTRSGGYNVILCNSDYLPGLHREHIELLRRRRVDGIILGSVLYDDPEVEGLIGAGFPCIMYNRRLRSGRGNYVVCDNVRAGLEVTQHLIGLGHRRIGFVAGPAETSTAHERFEGYRQALEAAGISFDEHLVRQGAYKPAAAFRAAEELLKSNQPPSAIVGGNDVMALSVLQAAGELGVSVPEDLAVVGLDDIGIAAHHNVQLTTVSHHAIEMAELAARWMLEIIQDPRRFAQQPFQHILRPTLVIRRTCGAMQKMPSAAIRPHGVSVPNDADAKRQLA